MKHHFIAFWLWLKSIWYRVFPKTISEPLPPGYINIEARIDLLKDASVYWHAQNPRGEQYLDILAEIAQLEKMEKQAAYVPGKTITRLK